MHEFQKRLEIFFINLPPKTRAVYRSDEEGLYIGINQNFIPNLIDQIEQHDFKIMKSPD